MQPPPSFTSKKFFNIYAPGARINDPAPWRPLSKKAAAAADMPSCSEWPILLQKSKNGGDENFNNPSTPWPRSAAASAAR
jgi:hypothetical protein